MDKQMVGGSVVHTQFLSLKAHSHLKQHHVLAMPYEVMNIPILDVYVIYGYLL